MKSTSIQAAMCLLSAALFVASAGALGVEVQQVRSSVLHVVLFSYIAKMYSCALHLTCFSVLHKSFIEHASI